MRLFAWSGIRGSHHRATALRFLTRLHLPSFLIVDIDEFRDQGSPGCSAFLTLGQLGQERAGATLSF